MKAKKCKQVVQQCSVCGHQFSLMYWEDGTYTYLDDPCDCHAEFIPLGPSISEWIEEMKRAHGYDESKPFSYDDLPWSDNAIAQIREEAMESCARHNGVVDTDDVVEQSVFEKMIENAMAIPKPMHLYIYFTDEHVEKHMVTRFTDLSQTKSQFYYYEEPNDEHGKGKTFRREDIICFEVSPYPLKEWEE